MKTCVKIILGLAAIVGLGLGVSWIQGRCELATRTTDFQARKAEWADPPDARIFVVSAQLADDEVLVVTERSRSRGAVSAYEAFIRAQGMPAEYRVLVAPTANGLLLDYPNYEHTHDGARLERAETFGNQLTLVLNGPHTRAGAEEFTWEARIEKTADFRARHGADSAASEPTRGMRRMSLGRYPVAKAAASPR